MYALKAQQNKSVAGATLKHPSASSEDRLSKKGKTENTQIHLYQRLKETNIATYILTPTIKRTNHDNHFLNTFFVFNVFTSFICSVV